MNTINCILQEMKSIYNKDFLIIALVIIYASCASAIPAGRILIDDGWKFSHVADSLFINDRYDDSEWEKVSLPHDWSVLNDFNRDEPSGNDGGYLPTGKGYYRKMLDIPETMIGKPCDLYFEGAYMNSEVFVNGHRVGGHPYGYTSFRCNIGPYLKSGKNVIAVSVDNSMQKNSRWYSGSGLYRHVWIEPHEYVYIKPWSLQITTPRADAESGIVRINYSLINSNFDVIKNLIKLTVIIDISNNNGYKQILKDTVTIQPGEYEKYCSNEIQIDNPLHWSFEAPNLYTVGISLRLNDKTIEKETDKFGFRTIEFSADKGFRLNGKSINISGACLHHDNGILGAASYDDAEIRKVKLIKDAGFNAVRTSHNPPAPAFLAACDSIGLLVIDEAFDGWKEAKNQYDYSILYDNWWDKDVSAMVERDRNHPSIICWSIGNEIIERKSPDAVKMAHNLVSKCKELDHTRPVTSALAAWDQDWEIYDPLAAQHDIVGYNYMIHKAESDHERVPSRIIWQTESYPRDAFSNWKMVNEHPYVIGDFVWTGIDYIGESGIGRHYYEGDPEGEHYHRPLWPWHNSCCGDIDIIGERKPVSNYREMLYSSTPKLYMSVREPDGYNGKIKETLWGTYPTSESWNWPGHEGKPIEIEVISNYPEVEFFQNGKSIGKKPTSLDTEYKAIFTIPYSIGSIKAIALDKDGNKTDSVILSTSGKPYAIRLKSDKDYLGESSQSLAYVIAEIVDKDEFPVTNADIPVVFVVHGDAEVIATGSADPKDPRGYYHNDRITYAGKAMGVIKRAKKDRDGKNYKDIVVTVQSNGLKSGKLILKNSDK